VTLRVHNTGAPIPPDVLPHVFDPFRRARTPNPADGAPAGLGLGLFIACEITRAHGGEIRVTSDAARGTTFVVTLPRAA
jgi:signal transduction histidine kinase